MPLQNRVDPFGELHAVPEHGSLMGNRGILHDREGKLGISRWRHKNWIYCRLKYGTRRRKLWSPGKYTELFFLDEATALAAGHRPCGKCLPERCAEFKASLSGSGLVTADDVDHLLHAARTKRNRSKVTYRAAAGTLPDRVMFARASDPTRAYLNHDGETYAWSFAGYTLAESPPTGEAVIVLTPKPVVDAVSGGFRPSISLRRLD